MVKSRYASTSHRQWFRFKVPVNSDSTVGVRAACKDVRSEAMLRVAGELTTRTVPRLGRVH